MKEQKFTQPPPRYNEASLVKALEDKGIGRPSTYQQILSVIMTRDYVAKEKGRFNATQLGEAVNDLLVDHFDEIFDYNYTAKLETDLDQIEDGSENWVDALTEFYTGFKAKLQKARSEMKDLKREGIPTEERCEKCGSQMVIRWGRFGRFLACTNFPECRNTREAPDENSEQEDTGKAPNMKQPCEKCGQPMVIKKGQYGDFLACSGYPNCKNTKKIVRSKGQVKLHAKPELDEKCPKCDTNLVLRHGRFGEFVSCGNYPTCRYIKPDQTGVKCPQCGEGNLVGRKSRRGRAFFACDRYPDCDFTLWNRPVPETCPECGASYLLKKTTKKKGSFKFCGQKGCSFEDSDPMLDTEETKPTPFEILNQS
jgi:DNA topoisomerase-1